MLASLVWLKLWRRPIGLLGRRRRRRLKHKCALKGRATCSFACKNEPKVAPIDCESFLFLHSIAYNLEARLIVGTSSRPNATGKHWPRRAERPNGQMETITINLRQSSRLSRPELCAGRAKKHLHHARAARLVAPSGQSAKSCAT